MVFSFRVFKKSSIDGSLTLYLEQVDFVGEDTPIRGVLNLENGGSGYDGQDVSVILVVSFRYGREEDETLGLSFRKELLLDTVKVLPDNGSLKEMSSFQSRLIKRLGSHAYPFTLNFPRHSPTSVFLLSGENSTNPPGVEYSVRLSPSSDPSLPISKSQPPPNPSALSKSPPPTLSICKDFIFSPGTLTLTASLDKSYYTPNEPLRLKGTLSNTTSSPLGPLSATLTQKINLSLTSGGNIQLPLGKPQMVPPIHPGETRSISLMFRPGLENTEGLEIGPAVGDLGRPQLAPSTLIPQGDDPDEVFGVRVGYVLQLKIPLGGLYKELTGELPFLLLGSEKKGGDDLVDGYDEFSPAANRGSISGPSGSKDKNV